MNRRAIYNIAIAGLLTCLFFFATRNVYHLPFSYGDDHRALAMLHPEKASADYKAALYGNTPDLKGCFSIDYHLGRFRPLTWSYDKLLCLICGDNTHLFRLSNLVILFLSVLFLLGIFSTLGVDAISALIVAAFFVFGRNNETWWTLIPPPQDVGECLLLAGMYVWLWYRKREARGFYLLPAFLFFLASISKESFIFCVPILLLTDYFFFNPTKKLFVKEYWLSLVACFLPFMGLLITVLSIGKIYSYTYAESIWYIFGYNIFQFIGASGFFLAPLLVCLVKRNELGKSFTLKLILTLLLWGGTQLILLKGIKLDDQHHYLMPWLIYPVILTAIALSEIRKMKGATYGSVVFIYFLAIMLFVKNTNANSTSYSAQLKAYYNMLDTIKKDTSAPYIIYLGDNACLGDWINGTRIIMDNMGIRQKLYFATTATSIPAWQKDYAEHSPQNAFQHIPIDSVFYPDGRWIIFVENSAKNGMMNGDISIRMKDTTWTYYGRQINGAISYIKYNNKECRIYKGRAFYFSMPYPGHSLGDILRRGDTLSVNRKGFYAVKMNEERRSPYDKRPYEIP